MYVLFSKIVKFSLSGVLTCAFLSVIGCRPDAAPERNAGLTVSVSSIVAEPFGPDGGDVVCEIDVTSNRSWTAILRAPLSQESAVNWVKVTPSEAEYPSGTSYSRKVTVVISSNLNSNQRVCELVFHAVGGEVIVPIKQMASL